MQKTTNQLTGPNNVNTCPFCAGSPVQWRTRGTLKGPEEFCTSCGQPKIEAPSGAYALCVKEVSLFARPCLSLYTLGNHKVEVDIHNEEDASTLNATLSGALLGCQLNRVTNFRRRQEPEDGD